MLRPQQCLFSCICCIRIGHDEGQRNVSNAHVMRWVQKRHKLFTENISKLQENEKSALRGPHEAE